MKQFMRALSVLALCATVTLPGLSTAQATMDIPAAITTRDKVEARLGTLEFKDGMPSKDTLAKVYDKLDLVHAFDAFVNTFQGVKAPGALANSKRFSEARFRPAVQ